MPNKTDSYCHAQQWPATPSYNTTGLQLRACCELVCDQREYRYQKRMSVWLHAKGKSLVKNDDATPSLTKNVVIE